MENMSIPFRFWNLSPFFFNSSVQLRKRIFLRYCLILACLTLSVWSISTASGYDGEIAKIFCCVKALDLRHCNSQAEGIVCDRSKSTQTFCTGFIGGSTFVVLLSHNLILGFFNLSRGGATVGFFRDSDRDFFPWDPDIPKKSHLWI